MAYELEGNLLEVCTCNILCPCWVGEDPDGGTCDTVVAWHIDKGTIDGTDVSNLTMAATAHIPGNILTKGSWLAQVFVDDKSTPQQEEALLNVWTGKLGGPVADLVELIGEVVGVERTQIDFRVQEGKGTIKIGSGIDIDLAPFQGPSGKPTTLQDSIFSTIPGSPVYVGKAAKYKNKTDSLGFDIDLTEHNAISGPFRFEA